jgi:hypothetical protein
MNKYSKWEEILDSHIQRMCSDVCNFNKHDTYQIQDGRVGYKL